MIYTLTLNPAVDRQITVPEIIFQEVLRASDSQLDFGGKGLNVSRMLSELGVSNTAVGFVGGKSGELVEEGLNALGISTRFVQVPGETRTNVSIVDTNFDNYIKVNEPGPVIPETARHEMLRLVSELTRPGDWWVLSGSLPPGVPSGFYADLIRMIQDKDACAVLDTSGEALKLGVAAGPRLVKPNAEEAEELTGITLDSDAAVNAAMKQICTLGAMSVVISLGKDGAMIRGEPGAWKAEALTIKERNPIGAGDAMLAGVIWQLSEGKTLKEALTWGNACGAATAAQEGTTVGPRATVHSLVTKVQLKEI